MIENNISIDGRFQMRVNFNLKDTSRVGGKKAQIYLTTTINRERVRLFTGLSIEPEYWIKTTRAQIGEMAREDSSLGRVQLQYNKNINKELKKILGYCKEYGVEVSNTTLMNDPILTHSKEHFEEFMKSKIRGEEANIRRNPQIFIENYINRKSTMTNRDTSRRITKGTIYNHKNALRRLLLFCTEKRLRFVWELFDARFEELFTAWMQDNGYAANTIASQFSVMKIWLTEAECDGISIDKRYHKWITKSREVDNIYLSEEEIQRIYSLDFNSDELRAQIDPRDNIEITRDLFIVACWTGLRFGDWKDLSQVCINEADATMTVHTHKTNKTVVIPLHSMVKAILDKYNGKFPKSVNKTHTLKQIRKCGQLAGITAPVSIQRVKGGKSIVKNGAKYQFIMNHTARRSFATNMYLKGTPTRSIMEITGHTTEDNFMKYIKLDKLEHAKIVAEAFTR